MRKYSILVFTLVLAVAGIVYAAEFKCIGERIEKNGSSWGYAKMSGSDYRIEKGSSTIGYAKKRNSKWAIEDSGSSTLAWLNGNTIEKFNGSSWTSLNDAKSLCDGPDPVAAAIWVLKQNGKF
jgi:hypothetical protein